MAGRNAACNPWVTASAVVIALQSAGCATRAPQFVAHGHDARLERGVMLLADSCIQRRILAGRNHFVLNPSDAASAQLTGDAAQYLTHHGLGAPVASATAVCGVPFEIQQPKKLFAEEADGKVSEGEQPLRASALLREAIPDGKVYGNLAAQLQAAAVLLAAQRGEGKELVVNKPVQLPADTQQLLAKMAQRHGAGNVMFLALSGNSMSAGLVAAQFTALVGLGVAAAVAAGPIAVGGTFTTSQTVAVHAATAGGAQFMGSDGWRLVGVVVDPQSGEAYWGNAITGLGDPLEARSIGDGNGADRLLRSLLKRPAEHWSPPGRAAVAAAGAAAGGAKP